MAGPGRYGRARSVSWRRRSAPGPKDAEIDDFEQQGFIKRVGTDQSVDFDYRGIYRDVIDSVSRADVRWACELLSRLTLQQWNDAFRAAGYNPEQTSRYVSKIRTKVAQGLAVTARPPNE